MVNIAIYDPFPDVGCSNTQFFSQTGAVIQVFSQTGAVINEILIFLIKESTL